VSGNHLNYFPNGLRHRNFHQLDISNNKFLTAVNFVRECDHIYTYVGSAYSQCSLAKLNVQSLRNLSFCSLFLNGVKYKRQEIPRTLWHFYDLLFRCGHCRKLMLPTKVFLIHSLAVPLAMVSLVKSHNSDRIMYQAVVCHCKMPYTLQQ